MKMFEAVTRAECCLCGSTENLTGEHKIKASALREIFGRDAMVIGHFDGTSEPRLAQGPKSSALHFAARMCGDCNAARTQRADRAFDRFKQQAAAKLVNAPEAESLFPTESFPDGTPETLNVFRYFAKLLCCQIADINGPRLPLVAAFALGETDFNPIKLWVRADPTYQDYTSLSGDFSGFAGHGGLTIEHDRAGTLTSFRSTLTLGPVQYVYWVEFNGPVEAELEEADPAFFASTQNAFKMALETPMPEHQRRKLGFASNTDGA